MVSLYRSSSMDSLDSSADRKPKKEYPLFDATPSEATEEEKLGATEWFRTLKEYIHDPLFPEVRTDVRVRVAVIGAGVDYTHPEIHQALEDGRIVDCKGFPERLDPAQDFEGVGTYCVSVIMRTMPWVSIYLARVVDEDGRLVKENRYAATVEAIAWAREQKADIICIPWGLPKEKTAIYKVVAAARSADVAVFARGPSYRNGMLRSFPANSIGNVFCAISAANASGAAMEEKSRYLDEYFHALGVGVPGANTSHKGKGKEPLKLEINRDGHSVATCVATGLAAMWIGYIRAYMDADTKITIWNVQDFLFLMDQTTTDVFPGSSLTPWSTFGQNRNIKRLIKCLLKWPSMVVRPNLFSMGMSGVDHFWLTEHITIPHEDGAEDTTPIVVGIPWATDSSAAFIDRANVTVNALRDLVLSRTINTAVVIVHGNKGTGKSELVKQYVRQANAMGWYRSIAWIDASNDLETPLSLAFVVRSLGPQLPWRDLHPPQIPMQYNPNQHYLLVLDNVPNFRFLLHMSFPLPNVQFIVTSSAEGPPHVHKNFKVTDWKPEDLESLFRTVFGNPIPVLADNQFLNVFKNLQMNPLTTKLAALYLRESNERLHHQIATYEATAKKLRSTYQMSEEQASVAAIVAASLQQCSTEGLRLLCLLAFMHFLPVPLWTMTPEPRFSDVTLRRIFSSKALLLDMIGPLARYGLVDYNTDIGGDESISIHPRIQQVIRDFLELGNMKEISKSRIPEQPVYWIHLATEFILLNYPRSRSGGFLLYNINDALQPHALKCFQYSEEYGILSENLALLLGAVSSYTSRIEPSMGEQFGRRAVKMLERIYGVVDYRSAYAMENLARVRIMGPVIPTAAQFSDKFIKVFESDKAVKVLDLLRKRFGADDLALLPAVYNCVSAMHPLLSYNGEPFYLQLAADILERHYGKRCGVTRYGHLKLYRANCRRGAVFDGIRGMQRIVDEAGYPADKVPPDILQCLTIIAAEAKTSAGPSGFLREEIIKARVKILEIVEADGDSKSDLAKDSLHDLANSYSLKGQWEKANQCNEKLVALAREDPDHKLWDMMSTLNWSFNCTLNQKDYPAAMKIAEEQLAFLENKHGANSPKIIVAINNIARVFRKMGKTREAFATYERALTYDDEAVRANASDFFSAYMWLSSISWRFLKLQDALRFVEKAITLGERYTIEVGRLAFGKGLVKAGVLLVAFGRFQDARMRLNRAPGATGPPPPPPPPPVIPLGPPPFMPPGPHVVMGPPPPPPPPPPPHFQPGPPQTSPQTLLHIRTTEGWGNLKFMEGKFTEAINDYRSVVSMGKGVMPPLKPPGAFSAQYGLGTVYRKIGAYDQALQEFKRILDAIATPYIPPIGHVDWFSDFYAEIGGVYNDLGKFDQALKYKFMGIEVLQVTVDRGPYSEPRRLVDIGDTYRQMGKLEEARDYYQRALDKRLEVGDPDHPDVSFSYEAMADYHKDQMQFDLALENYEKALAIRKAYFGDDHLFTAGTLIRMAEILPSLNRLEDALKACHRALRIMRVVYNDPSHLYMGHGLEVLACIFGRFGKYVQALDLLHRILDVRPRRPPQQISQDRDIDTLGPLVALASTYALQQKYEKGIAYAKRAVKLAETVFGVEHILTARPLRFLGIVLKLAGRNEEAEVHLNRSKNLLVKNFGTDHAWLRYHQFDIDWFVNGKYRLEELPDIDLEEYFVITPLPILPLVNPALPLVNPVPVPPPPPGMFPPLPPLPLGFAFNPIHPFLPVASPPTPPIDVVPSNIVD